MRERAVKNKKNNVALKLVTICLLFFQASSASAGKITSTEDWNYWIESEPYSRSEYGRRIKICRLVEQNSSPDCLYYPESNGLSDFGFEGTPDDWERVLKRCLQFNNINTFQTVVSGLTTLALGGQLGGVKKIWDSSRSGLMLVRQSVISAGVSIPHGISAGSGVYPKIDNDGVRSFVNHINIILNPGATEIFKRSVELNALGDILNACSFKLKNWLESNIHRECMNGCHGTGKESNKALSERTIKKTDPDELSKLELKNYLNSLE